MSQDSFLKQKKEHYDYLVPSRASILSYLTKRKTSISRKGLAKELNINGKKQSEGFRRRLCAMERDGQLIFNKLHYMLPKDINLLRGTVIGHRDGFGFLRIKDHKNDYYLSYEQMKTVIHGDIVLAYIKGETYKNRQEAGIMQILVPKNSKIIGRFYIHSDVSFVIPEDNRLRFDIIIPQDLTYGAHIGYIVVVSLIQRPTHCTKAIGKIVEILGKNMGVNMAIDIALRTYDIPYIWSPEVKQQIVELKKEESKSNICGRIDLRKLPLVTIDNEDSKDFDDAIYCEKNNYGWCLWVAISDVSYYVRPYTPLDYEARNRSTSIYFPSKVIPMLPEILSNDLCSLIPKADRLCIICEMIISTQGYLSSYKFYEAIVNSHARLTYNVVWQILQGNQELYSNYPSYVQSIIDLHTMYKTLEKARIKRGSISFEIEEAKFILDTECRIERIEPKIRNDAHKMVEECMILANISAACFVKTNKEPALYRVHDRPSKDHVLSLRIILKELGLILGGGDNPSPKDYAKIMNLIIGRPDQEMLQTMLLRSMKQAIYDSENRGHFGLALKTYAHFTSPIRRYPDLLLLRSIKYLINKKKINNCNVFTGGWHFELEEMIKLGQQCSINERRADEATRDVDSWLKCDFMKKHVGKIFSGIITSVTDFGFFVRLNNLFIDGLVHVSSLIDDYYHHDSSHQRLIGKSSNQIYCLGDSVKIRVKNVHIEEYKIDFSLISSFSSQNRSIIIEPYLKKNYIYSCNNKKFCFLDKSQL